MSRRFGTRSRPPARSSRRPSKARQTRCGGKWQEYNAWHRKEIAQVEKLNQLLSQVDQYELSVANSLWGEKTYPFRQSYLDTVNKYYRTGGIFPVDFINEGERARQQINAWVERQTQDRIKNIIPEQDLSKWKLALVNAIYFKGEWSEPFEAKETRDEDFALADGTKVPVPMMRLVE